MLGLDSYGSGSESDGENEEQQAQKPHPVSRVSKSQTNLAAPSSNHSSLSKISLPAPKTTKRAPKKIAIGLPALPKDGEAEDDDIEHERPAAKRARTGVGSSSLLSMLPAPKQKGPVAPAAAERVLGGGGGPGLVFNTRTSAAPTAVVANGEDEEEYDAGPAPQREQDSTTTTNSTTASSSLPFLPLSLAKGRTNISLEEQPRAWAKPSLPSVSAAPPVDFFSLGGSKASNSSNPDSNSSFSLPTLSSAPTLPTFEPPEPTPQDPYPGYYQLPSGSWAAHDTEYYAKFRKKWQAEYDAYVRALEKGKLKGFEGYEEGASEVDAMKEMEKAKVEIKEREDKKALTKGDTGPVEQPRMKFSASKLSGIARSRHQLSTLLKEAYENRDALEERIAEGRRNRKEAGNKYGF